MDASIDDSGFDSDHSKMPTGGNQASSLSNGTHSAIPEIDQDSSSDNELSQALDSKLDSARPSRKPSDLKMRIEKQSMATRKLRQPGGVVSSQPLTKPQQIVSRSRLLVPTKSDVAAGAASDTQPLVIIDMDESEDEFASPRLTRQAQREITQQLIKDGYNLDLEPDDEDLDLIPPRPLNERCMCCNTQINICSIQ